MPQARAETRLTQAVAAEIIALARADIELRAELAASRELAGGYHPRLRALHETNAARLLQIVEEHGWPDGKVHGAEAAEACWLVVQHAISAPAFMRRALELLTDAVEVGRAPAWQIAYLADRIAVFEGKPQLFGTQFDWDDKGELSPAPLMHPERVDELRDLLALPPIAVEIMRQRADAERDGERAPDDLALHRARQDAFARSAGWRS